MGWFLMDLPDVDDLKIFVLAWGWVGSLVPGVLGGFDPIQFSSPLGVGLVRNCVKCWNQPIEFSSPSGDGCFYNSRIDIPLDMEIFVPGQG